MNEVEKSPSNLHPSSSSASTVDDDAPIPFVDEGSDGTPPTLTRINSGTVLDPLSVQMSREDRAESLLEGKIPVDDLDWDGPDDPENPYNWSNAKKWYNTLTAGVLLLVVTLGSSLFVSGIKEMEAKFKTSQEVTLLGITLYMIGLCCGPIIGAPLSEMYGRKIVYVSTFPIAILFTMGYGLSNNIQSVLICRFFSGVFGSPAMAVAGGTILDMWRPEMLGVTMSVFCLTPFLGPVLGPVVGGFSAVSKGWRWTAWIQLMFSGLCSLLLIFTKETYRPVLLKNRAKKRNIAFYEPKKPLGEFLMFILGSTITKPIILLFTESIVLLLSFYVALLFAILYCFFEAYPLIFVGIYHMEGGVSGLPFIGIGVGLVFGAAIFIGADRWRFYHPKLDENGNRQRPQMKDLLLPAKIGAILLPISMFWIGWTARKSVHWMAPTAAGVFFGAPMILIFLSALHYITASYPPQYSASALAGNNLFRYAFASAFPLFTVQMFNKMGIDWACSLFGFVAVALMPIPWVFVYFEEYIQSNSRFSHIALAIKKQKDEEKSAKAPEV